MLHKKTLLYASMAALIVATGITVEYTNPIRITEQAKLRYFLKRRGVTKKSYNKNINSVNSYGCTMQDIFSDGIKDWKSKGTLGVNICETSDYKTFHYIMRDIIKWYHDLKSIPKYHQCMDYKKITTLKLDPENQYISNINLKAVRNLQNTPLGKVKTDESMSQTKTIIINVITRATQKLGINLKTCNQIQQLPANIRSTLINQGITTNKAETTPKGMSILYNKNIVIFVNATNHLEIISIAENGNVKAAARNLFLLLSEIKLPFAKDDEYGYLGASPANIGTCITVITSLQLPLLAQKQNQIKAIAKTHNLQIEGNEVSPETFTIRNKSQIGINEIDLINHNILAIAEIIQKEQELTMQHR